MCTKNLGTSNLGSYARGLWGRDCDKSALNNCALCITLLLLHGMPTGHDVSRFRSGIFFFFIVVTNVHINLCIKLCPPPVRIYCSDCLQQKRPNQNLFFRHISRERGPTHHFLCDVKSSFDLFIKTRLNSSLSQKGSIVLIVLNKSGPIKLHYPRVYHEGGDPLISTCATSKQIIIWKSCFRSMAATCLNLRLRICRFQKEHKRFSSVKSK